MGAGNGSLEEGLDGRVLGLYDVDIYTQLNSTMEKHINHIETLRLESGAK